MEITFFSPKVYKWAMFIVFYSYIYTLKPLNYPRVIPNYPTLTPRLRQCFSTRSRELTGISWWSEAQSPAICTFRPRPWRRTCATVHPKERRSTLVIPSSIPTVNIQNQLEWSIQSWRTLLVYWRVSWFSWSIYYLLINFQYLTECTNTGRYLPQSHLNFATWPSLVGPTVQELETWKTLWHEVNICQNHLHHMEQLFYVVLALSFGVVQLFSHCLAGDTKNLGVDPSRCRSCL